MRLLIQRCISAAVWVDGQTVGQIKKGMVVFVGFGRDDQLHDATILIDKLLNYRLFEDKQGKMGLNISQIQGEILWVSQFTLYAKTDKGLRPDFSQAMPPQAARQFYTEITTYLCDRYQAVQQGIFAADMQVQLINDGPVTLLLDSDA